MRVIELTENEAAVLLETLESSLSDLRTERIGTDNRELHQAIKQKEAMIGEILSRLKMQ